LNDFILKIVHFSVYNRRVVPQFTAYDGGGGVIALFPPLPLPPQNPRVFTKINRKGGGGGGSSNFARSAVSPIGQKRKNVECGNL